MKRILFALVGAAALAGAGATMARESVQSDGELALICGIRIPSGGRDRSIRRPGPSTSMSTIQRVSPVCAGANTV